MNTDLNRMPFTNATRPLRWVQQNPAAAGLVLAVIFAALTGLDQASDKRFFFDEVATIAVARQESPSAIWNALAQAADAQPPAYYILEALSARVVGDPHVAYRLPSLLGFLTIPIALWFFVRKRLGDVPALAAALLPLVMPVFTLYAIEARPYALMTGAIAVALLMWQDADKPWRTAALALCLILATTFAYQALLAFIPFGLAELVRNMRLRQVRVRVWLAFAAGCLPIVICWPLLSVFRQSYGAAFWARPQLIAAYGELVGMSSRWVAPLVAATVIAWLLSLRRRQDRIEPAPASFPVEEVALVLSLVCLPTIIYSVSVTLHTPMVSRYALPAVLGFAIAAASLASAGMGPRGVQYLLGAVLSIIAVQQMDHWRFGQSNPQIAVAHSDAATLRRVLERAGLAGSPVVISDGMRYLSMAYYAGSDREHDFVYLADPAAARKSIRTDSVDMAIVKLAPYLPMRVIEPAAFFAEHPVFLVFSENTLWDYLPRRLVKEGHSVQVLAVDGADGGNHTLLRIELRGPGAGIDH